MNIQSKNVASASSATATATASLLSKAVETRFIASPLKVLYLKVLCLTLLCLFVSPAFAQHPPLGGGDGAEATPYLISTGAHLEALATYVNAGGGSGTQNKFYKMMNNIDLSSYSNWMPIGKNTDGGTAYFNGNFDGNNKVVQNLTINRPTQNNIGLFGYIRVANIKNLGVENCNVVGGTWVGGLVGHQTCGSIHTPITNCYTTGTVSGEVAGGLIGDTDGANESSGIVITNCYSTATVSGSSTLGGLVGALREWCLITNSYATGNVTGATGSQNIGGLVGAGTGHSEIINSYATGNVIGSTRVGGLAGWGDIFVNCYATGNVTGTSGNYIGGIVGYYSSTYTTVAKLTNCYATGNVNGTGDYVGGLVGWGKSSFKIRNCVAANGSVSTTSSTATNIARVVGYGTESLENNYANSAMTVLKNGSPVTITDNLTGQHGMGKTLAELKVQSFYTTAGNWTSDGTWDFTTIWKICNGSSFPIFQWQTCPPAPETPPYITTTTLPNGTVGTAYSQQLTATGTAPITWTLQSGSLPTGLTLSSSGVISGTPSAAGTSTFTVKATNSAGSDTKQLSITIVSGATPPVITTTTLPDGTTGTAYSQQLAATGTTPITWTLQSGSLPTGLALSSAGVISGTPSAAGTFSFTVKATNSAGSDTKALSITVIAAAIPPTITTTTLSGGLVGTAYSQQLAATGDTPITWTLQSGNLPAGLSLSTAGLIAGTPTTAGTANFTVKATNNAGSDTKSLSITITTTAVAPVITTTNLPEGKTETPYSAQLEATGTAPITWTLESGALPAGLTLSSAGLISGTPSAAGTFTFTVKAANSAGNNSKQLNIKINQETFFSVSGKIIGNGSDETGKSVYLYKYTASGNPEWGMSIYADNSGNYSFTNIPAGEYIIVSQQSVTSHYLTTYYGDVITWEKAKKAVVSNASLTNINITLQSLPVINGAGTIPGYVYISYDGKKGISGGQGEIPLFDVLVILEQYQSDWTTVAQALTDGNGHYQFEKLPAGKFRVLIDYPCIPMNDIITLTLAEGETAPDVNYIITDDGIDPMVGIEELGITNYELRIFPNPTDGEIIINNEQLTINNIEIFDVLGRMCHVETRCIASLQNDTTTINISHLPTGIYFLRIQTETGAVVRKVVKQ